MKLHSIKNKTKRDVCFYNKNYRWLILRNVISLGVKEKMLSNGLAAQLIKHASGTFMLKVLNLVLRLIIGMVLARMLGTEGYGIYAFPMAIVALLSVPSTAGLPQLLVRNVSIYYSKKQYGLMRGLLIRSNQFVLFVSLVFAGTTSLFYFSFGKIGVASPEGITFLFAMGLLPLIALKNVRMAILRGMRKVVIGQIPELIVKPVVFLIIIILIWLCHGKVISPWQAMGFQLFATGVAFVVGVALLVQQQPKKVNTCIKVYDSKAWLKSALPFMLLGVMQVINKQTDIVMLGIMRSSSEVGVYQAVVNGSMLITFVLMAVNTAQGPQIARLWELGERRTLQKMITASTRVVALTTLLSSFALIVGGEKFLELLFGLDFTIGITPLRILCVGQIVNGMAGSAGSILNMTGYENNASIAVCVSAIFNVILNAILVPAYGMEGAAIATAASMTVWNVLMVFWSIKYTMINPTALPNVSLKMKTI